MMRRAAFFASALALAGCVAAQPAPVVSTPSAVAPASEARAPEPPGSMQWLYGSAEGAAASVQTYRALQAFVEAAVRRRPDSSVVLTEGTTLAQATREPCGAKPFAVVLDADETAIQNQGLEYALAVRGVTSDRALLNRWQEQPRSAAPAMPGAVEALNAIRELGVTVIFNTNRDSPTAAATRATLEQAGVGPAEHLKTLFLRGDVDGKSGKDGRRWHIARSYCVVAMAGDQMGDFTDLLNERGLSPRERRRLATSGSVGALWGNGWFLLSNPVYGPGVRGSIDEVFEPENRWDGER